MSETLAIVDCNLESWIRKSELQELFPATGTNYSSNYNSIATYLNINVHPNVTMGAILQQIEQESRLSIEDVTYLNDHGPSHVNMVIRRASDLLSKSQVKLSPYEAYLLLLSIHFHDIGIWLGRDFHERRISEIMNIPEIKELLPKDRSILRVICEIAKAHGGYYEGDKDTLSPVTSVTHLNSQPIRNRFLAAVLRLADELADDKTRSQQFDKERIPTYSKIYHNYSDALISVDIKQREIDLKFEYTKAKAKESFLKAKESSEEIYLLDEIYNRTLKMLHEKQYCSRFLMSHGICIDRIRVAIEICDDDDLTGEPLKTFSYTLQEKGYPHLNDKHKISYYCPEANLPSGEEIAKSFI